MRKRHVTFPQDIVDLIEEAFQEDPELPFRFPSLVKPLERKYKRELSRELEQARAQASEQARAQNEIKVRQETLLRQMRHRFRDVPPGVVSRVESTAEGPMLDTWFERILDAHSLQEMGFDESG